MTMMVAAHGAPAASPRAVRRGRRRPARPNVGVQSPQELAAIVARRTLAQAPAAAPTAAAPAAAAPAAAPAVAAAPAAPAEIVTSPEYDAVDAAGVVGDISAGVTGDMVAPHISAAVKQYLNQERFPWLGTDYGAVVPGKVAGVMIGEVSGLVGNVVGDAVRGVMHGNVEGVAEGKPGLGWTPTPPNKLIAKLVKGVATSWADIALREFLKPPPPPPPPVYPPGVEPLPPVPTPAPPPPKTVLGQPIGPVITTAVTNAVYRTVIGAAYDQVVGPLVQRAANAVTGQAGAEIAPPKPLTPGRVANGFVDSVLGSLLVRSFTYPAKDGQPTPFAGTLGTSIMNNVIGAAWATVYGRGLGPAIENGVNQLAGIRSKEEQAKAKLPALEHFTRAATRGVAVGATTYVLGNALQATMVRLGSSIGGVGGALIGMAGAALIGAVGASVVDATIGPMLGRLGGQIYSWLSGKPAYEQRAPQAPAPGPTPGDPVKAPNGNPGTVPAPPAALPLAAPAAGAARRRRRTGNAAVDRTAPAMNVPRTKLAAIAARG